jgi:hypothetical protein
MEVRDAGTLPCALRFPAHPPPMLANRSQSTLERCRDLFVVVSTQVKSQNRALPRAQAPTLLEGFDDVGETLMQGSRIASGPMNEHGNARKTRFEAAQLVTSERNVAFEIHDQRPHARQRHRCCLRGREPRRSQPFCSLEKPLELAVTVATPASCSPRWFGTHPRLPFFGATRALLDQAWGANRALTLFGGSDTRRRVNARRLHAVPTLVPEGNRS